MEVIIGLETNFPYAYGNITFPIPTLTMVIKIK